VQSFVVRAVADAAAMDLIGRGCGAPPPARRAALLGVALLAVALLTAGLVPGAAGRAAASDVDAVGVWPLVPQPEVVAAFDPPDVPWGAGHRGVDLRGRPGQVVHAAMAGEVTFAGSIAGRGVVVVDHGDTRTTYEPVSASVSVGESLGQGAALGTLELAGSHCPPMACLHWGWLRGDEYLDPLDLVGAGPVRLLPLWRVAPVQLFGAGRQPMPVISSVLLPWTGPYAVLFAPLLTARAPPR
jgi:murein DD-endopeptidase MepM/ murein hydrolase activator NlpD